MNVSPTVRSFRRALLFGFLFGVLCLGSVSAGIIAEGDRPCDPNVGVAEGQVCDASHFDDVMAGEQDGPVGLSGSDQHVLLNCVNGEIADYAEYSTVGIFFPVEHLGESCQEANLTLIFPSMAISSPDDPLIGWSIALWEAEPDKASICVGATLFEATTTTDGITIRHERQSTDCLTT